MVLNGPKWPKQQNVIQKASSYSRILASSDLLTHRFYTQGTAEHSTKFPPSPPFHCTLSTLPLLLLNSKIPKATPTLKHNIRTPQRPPRCTSFASCEALLAPCRRTRDLAFGTFGWRCLRRMEAVQGIPGIPPSKGESASERELASCRSE